MSKKDRKHRQDESAQAPAEQQAPPAEVAEEQAAEMAEESLTPEQSLQAERDDLMARLQRLSADYVNYQKRAQRDMAQAREFANEDLVRSLLGVVDDMERALEAARANHPADDPLLVGMQMVHDNLMGTLGKFGLEPIEAAGQPFDPEQHAAMMQQPTDEQEPGMVLQELQKGYRLKGRTIRPSSVIVSAAPPDEQ